MKRIKPGLFLLLLLICQNAAAQFHQTGDDPGGLRWNYIETQSYKLIYPAGCDSLAQEYARSLEHYHKAVGRATGVEPGELQRGRTPVILHTHTAHSNGSVAWAPKRMELYSNPQAYDPEPLPWIDNLCIHESRHVAQMQSGYRGVHKVLGYIIGEMWPGACAGIYFRKDFLEGDAVVCETALSNSGRGRTADFLNHYMMSFDQGKWRNLHRWFAGSERYGFPDYYAFGYLFFGGLSAYYDDPKSSQKFINIAGDRPLGFFTNKNRVCRTISGKKAFDVFPEIAQKTYDSWKENADLRKPYIPSTQLTQKAWFHTDYGDNMILGQEIYSIKEDLAHMPRLVRIDSLGNEKQLCYFSPYAGALYHSPAHNHIFWSETVTDERWTLAGYSIIRKLNLKTGEVGDLTRKTRYYNPNPSPSEAHISVTEHFVEGQTALTVISGATGEHEYSFPAPDSVQLIESAWIDDLLYASGVSENGFGIYHLRITNLEEHDALFHAWDADHPFQGKIKVKWECILQPQPVKIKNFGDYNGHLVFTSDRNGNNEFYHFYPEDRSLYQITSTRYGAEDFQYSEDGKRLYYSMETLDGKMIAYTETDSLLHRKVSYSDRYHYPLADKLSQQERELAQADTTAIYKDNELCIIPKDSVQISEPKKYSKFGNLFQFHSWAPIYINPDKIMEMSFDKMYEMIGLGIMGSSQNELGSAVLQGGYCAHQDPAGKTLPWRHSAHLKFTYSGWYPVLEMEVNFNDRAAEQTTIRAIASDTYYRKFDGLRGGYQSSYLQTNKPYVKGDISLYIPFRWMRGGFTGGLIPRINYSISNDCIDPNYQIFLSDNEGILTPIGGNTFKIGGSKHINQSISGSLRGYWMMNTAESAVYPRWGIGAEIGATLNFWYPLVAPAGLGYLYGYTPGFFPSHGLRLSAKCQRVFAPTQGVALFKNGYSDMLPRGFKSSNWSASQLSMFSTLFTVDYAMPFYMDDLMLGYTVFNVRRIIVTPHFDYSYLHGFGDLWSAGLGLTFDFRSIFGLWLKPSIGVSVSYNGGSGCQKMGVGGGNLNHFHIAPIISFAF